MKSKNVYFRYLIRELIGIEIVNDNNQIIVIIRRPNRPTIREELGFFVDKKGATKNRARLFIDL